MPPLTPKPFRPPKRVWASRWQVRLWNRRWLPAPWLRAPRVLSWRGGETSGAVTQALGVDRLDIGPEIAPGVPWTFCTSAGRSIALTLKSGNFGQPEFFSQAHRLLEMP
jgi:hypothetical protein